MNWLRSKAKRLSLLALFAVALQLGLSFDHTHHDVAEAGISVSASLSLASTPDADHDHQGVHRDLCAICVTVAMANTLVAATPPSLALPLATTALQTAFHPEAIASDSRRSAFRSRAPPQA
ncbi:DUF2946 domain-containing protein [Afipia massiliensis]|uniref:DUF2946 domain-containing protein n=1 Tax=Afipia massiliensis TaxID=211460 RepID=A0A4U6BM09_9BRAD|nr:DUF2946 family protein [Afipia massiliensis]TKT70425.1 DUF2946 domain-containing protein [Afipia massiliensis]